MSEVLSYKCPNCGMPLIYDAGTQKFKCEYCDSSFSFDAIQGAGGNEEAGYDWGNYKGNVSNEELTGTVSYVCKFCGAEIVTDAVTAATCCPYCGNDVIVDDNLSGLIKPNAVLPFKINKDGLKDALRNYCSGKKLLPKNFLSDHEIEKIQGVYVPYWLYDCHTDGAMAFEGTRTKRWSDNDFDYVETSYFMIDCDGAMDFKQVPVDGSVKMDDALMDSVEPFNFNELKEFAPGYLSGYVATRFDDDADACLPRATERVKNTVMNTFSSVISRDYESLSVRRSRVDLSDTSVNYVLLPMYLITAKYNGENYQFAVNGQTGKVIGNLPVDNGKKNRWFFGLWLGIAAVFAILAIL